MLKLCRNQKRRTGHMTFSILPGYITKNSGSSTEEKAEIKIREKIMTSVLNTGRTNGNEVLSRYPLKKKLFPRLQLTS